jgi:N-terminal region of Chorein or VPS13/Vacuolar sorting-associated protein 13, N-terminal
MAKSIVFGILLETLGEYVEISRDKLKMAVWSGRIELYDMSLKSGALASLDLPIHVYHGSLGSLKVTIPWTSLGKSSTVIELDGLVASIGPSDDRYFTAEDLRRHSAELKRKILLRAERIAYAYMSGELRKKELRRTELSTHTKKKRNTSWASSVGASYVQGLIAKMLANIEFTFRNIHIRYEDGVAVSGRFLSAGITVDELSIITTDENWVEVAAVSHSKTQNNSNSKDTSKSRSKSKGSPVNSSPGLVMHKIATLRNVCVYWNTDSDGPLKNGLGLHSDSKWHKAMRSMIYTDAGTTKGTSCNNYVLAPPNVIIIKVAYDNEKSYEQNSSHRVNSTVTAAGAADADDADVAATKELDTDDFLSHEQRTRDTKGTGNSGCVIDVSVDMGSMQFAAGLEQMDQVS